MQAQDRERSYLRRVARPDTDPVRAAKRAVEGRLHVLPDYLIVGAMKGGTSALHAHLAEHPGVAPPVRKELHYFDVRPDHGLSWYRRQFPRRRDMGRLRDQLGYRPVTGEASPYYLFHPLAAGRIADALPGVRIVVMLRDPVRRAFSHHVHNRQSGREDLDFEAAVAAEPARLRGEWRRIVAGRAGAGYVSYAHRMFSYVGRGEYVGQIRVLFDLFGRERVLVVQSERYRRDVQDGYDEVCRFLGLPPHALADRDPRHVRTAPGDTVPGEVRLRRHFAPLDAELYDLLGWDAVWPAR